MENFERYGPVTRQVGVNAQKVRKARGLSLATVAERMTTLGRPMTLNSVSKIELQKRGVDLDDLVALARALDVPPLVLVFPIGDKPTVELLPGYEVRPWTAARWFTGEQPLPVEAPGEAWVDRQLGEDSPAALYRMNDELIRRWLRANRSVQESIDLGRGASEVALELRDNALDDISRHRREMRRLGLEPDPLPAVVPLDPDDEDVFLIDTEDDQR
jgi:transcriptional regulator with XRE-family HTH domain